jgi:hypothetical protein
MGQGQFLQRRDHPRARREPGSPGSRARGQKEARLVWPRRTQWRDQFAERVRSVLRSKPVYNACADICVAGRGLNHNSITGTLAAWTLRYCPFVSAGRSERPQILEFPLGMDAREVAKELKREGWYAWASDYESIILRIERVRAKVGT